jgi:hypothetical protein
MPLASSVRDAVERDLAPVRPRAAPWRRTLAFAPLGLLLVIASPLVWGLRGNLADLPAWATWGLSGVQALAGLLVVGASLRESVPGRTLSGRALAGVLAAALGVFVGITLVTDAMLQTPIPPSVRMRFVWECVGMAAVVGVPAVALVAWLAWRLLPVRPATAGALCGLGAGLLTDAGVRLFCNVDEPWHVLVAHGGAIAGLCALGALLSVGIDRLAARRARGR